MIVDLFHWSLIDIDATDIESLIPFVMRYPSWKTQSKNTSTTRRVYADQAEL